MKWHKLTTRKMTEDEVEIYGDKYDFMWDGRTPNINEEVLVTYPLSSGKFVDTYIDTWEEIGDGVGFENTDNDVIYWMELPKYNGELEKANGLLNEIREIDLKLRQLEHPFYRVSIEDYFIPFNEKYKQKFVDILKEIRGEMVEELNKLGVVEDD
ncbi:hypothetical protein [uncultured Gemella sp.]|uniref:hypothetical protein n=1 Tax=uncultured Gemella sp. TaxID=254352 RepID=UPI0028D3EC42|nr:hypothetical protein [uncultured Gemella sp.]